MKSFNQKEFGPIHNKDVHISYVKNGQRYYVSLMNSMNMHGGSMYFQANHMLVIKETELAENSVYFTVTDRTASGIVAHAYGEKQTKPATNDEHGYYYYECAECGHRYVPHYKNVFWAMHFGRTRYMKCPECGKRSWNKKVIRKD